MHYDRKVAQKLGDTTALNAVNKPQPQRVTEAVAHSEATPTAVSKPAPAPVSQTQTTPVAQTTSTQPKTSEQKPKADTMNINGIDVVVMKSEKPKTAQFDTIVAVIPSPEKIQGKNVFVLNPYSVPFKAAYYPYTSRPTYENNKTKFIIAKAGDTYKSLAASMQLLYQE